MTERHFNIGVIAARKKVQSAWIDHVWLPHAVLEGVPAAAPGTPVGHGTEELVYAGHAILTVHRSDTAHYRDNLVSGRPSLWVALRPAGDSVAVSRVTADPYEAEALADGLGDMIEAIPMPDEIRVALAAFVDAFHVDRPFIKRKRDDVGDSAPARMERPR
jgi:hypothetical protein